MRLLHTSDWHLGRSLLEAPLAQAQVDALDAIVRAVDEHDVDAVLISGDVYDRAVPPHEAVTLLAATLDQLARRVPVIVISGNHDSAVRLGFGASLYRDGIHVRTSVTEVGHPVELRDQHGPVLVYPVPFLDPDVARHHLGATADEPHDRSHEAVLSAAMRQVRADLSTRWVEGARSVVMAHAFVVGGLSSDSERDIRVGGTDAVPAEVFRGVDYVALGHLHGPQQLRTSATLLRYSGSPLRYSFSEATQRKSVTVVDLDAGGVERVDEVELRQPRGMDVISGPLDELLDPARHRNLVDCWLQVTVTDAGRPPEMRSRVLQRFPHALVVRHCPASGALLDDARPSSTTSLDPVAVAKSFVREVTGADVSTQELQAFRDAYEAVVAMECSA